MARPLCSGMEDQTYGLLPKATTLDEATPSSVQCSEAHLALDDLITGCKIEDHLLPIVIDREAEWEVEEILDYHKWSLT